MNDEEWRQRASQVIPGGMYGHMSTRALPEGHPQFFRSASGCRLTDVDGNEYIDFMCSYGPMIAGYGHPEIRAAADQQRREYDIGNGPSKEIVVLAETLTRQVNHADWAIFAKNGNDATTVCNMIARAKTGRRKILVAGGAYHGAQPWAARRTKGTPEEDYVHFPTYEFNNIDSVIDAAEQARGDLAGIMVSAFKHDAGQPQALTDPAFAQAIRRICDEHDAALILDDVRAGMRLSLDASWSEHGIQVDLSAWGKCIANGEPIAAVLGSDPWREAASRTFVTGSFWYQSAPMAATLATLKILSEQNAPVHIEKVGQQFRDGLAEIAQRHGHGLSQSGPPQMPTVMFDDDARFEKGNRFCQLALAEGVYLHPWHNMFLSLAHDEQVISESLARLDKAMGKLSDA